MQRSRIHFDFRGNSGGREGFLQFVLGVRLTRVVVRGHAEILALREAAVYTGNYRLPGATLYSTLEPCVMCAGALVAARVGRLVFGARDLRFGGVRSTFRLADSDKLNHQMEIVEGVLAVECVNLLRDFFAARRKKPCPFDEPRRGERE